MKEGILTGISRKRRSNSGNLNKSKEFTAKSSARKQGKEFMSEEVEPMEDQKGDEVFKENINDGDNFVDSLESSLNLEVGIWKQGLRLSDASNISTRSDEEFVGKGMDE